MVARSCTSLLVMAPQEYIANVRTLSQPSTGMPACYHHSTVMCSVVRRLTRYADLGCVVGLTPGAQCRPPPHLAGDGGRSQALRNEEDNRGHTWNDFMWTIKSFRCSGLQAKFQRPSQLFLKMNIVDSKLRQQLTRVRLQIKGTKAPHTGGWTGASDPLS